MSAKLVNHALATPNLLPASIGEALLLLSVATKPDSLQFLEGDGKKWTSDVEVRRIYIDLLRNAEKFTELRDFCEKEIREGVDDWKVVQGWIDGYIGVFRFDPSQTYGYAMGGMLIPVRK